MDARLSALLGLQADAASSPGPHDVTGPLAPTAGGTSPGSVLPAGWRRLSERDGWRPAPIGVYVSCP